MWVTLILILEVSGRFSHFRWNYRNERWFITFHSNGVSKKSGHLSRFSLSIHSDFHRSKIHSVIHLVSHPTNYTFILINTSRHKRIILTTRLNFTSGLKILTMKPVMFWRKISGMWRWAQSSMKCAPFSADSVKRMPLLPIMPTGCPIILAKPVTKVCSKCTHNSSACKSTRVLKIVSVENAHKLI